MQKTDKEYFNEIVMPTIEEFSLNPGSERHAILACLVLQSMNEHYFHLNKHNPILVNNCKSIDDYKSYIRANDHAFGIIMDIANSAKHLVLDKPKKTELKDLHHEVPAAMGILRTGFPLSPEPHIFVDKDNSCPLDMFTRHVASVWKTKL